MDGERKAEVKFARDTVSLVAGGQGKDEKEDRLKAKKTRTPYSDVGNDLYSSKAVPDDVKCHVHRKRCLNIVVGGSGEN